MQTREILSLVNHAHCVGHGIIQGLALLCRYTFFTDVQTIDERVRLWVDNSLIIDSWTSLAGTETSGTYYFDLGNDFYDITIEFAAQVPTLPQHTKPTAVGMSHCLKSTRAELSDTRCDIAISVQPPGTSSTGLSLLWSNDNNQVPTVRSLSSVICFCWAISCSRVPACREATPPPRVLFEPTGSSRTMRSMALLSLLLSHSDRLGSAGPALSFAGKPMGANNVMYFFLKFKFFRILPWSKKMYQFWHMGATTAQSSQGTHPVGVCVDDGDMC